MEEGSMSEIPQPSAQQSGAEPPRPPVADGEDKSLDPQSIVVSRISAAIWLLVLAAPLGVFATFASLWTGFATGTLLRVGGGALAFVAFALWCLWWPAVRYRHASYRLNERGLWIRRGVVWRSEISVPKSRVQHTDVSQGPLQRRFDLATLVLHTAGTQHAAVSLGGLSHSAALAIRDDLIEGGPDDAV